MEDKQFKTAVIRELNDRFRKSIPMGSIIPGRVVMTSGIQELTNDPAEPGKYLGKLLKTVSEFDGFDNANDPHEEHDFGAFDFMDQRVFWKIDYYAPDMAHGAKDPADARNTMRVLTIMLAQEY